MVREEELLEKLAGGRRSGEGGRETDAGEVGGGVGVVKDGERWREGGGEVQGVGKTRGHGGKARWRVKGVLCSVLSMVSIRVRYKEGKGTYD